MEYMCHCRATDTSVGMPGLGRVITSQGLAHCLTESDTRCHHCLVNILTTTAMKRIVSFVCMFCVCFVATGYSASGQEIPGSTERSESSVSIDPVVIVPGITTSWNWDVMRERNVVRDDWGFLVGVDHYDALIESLRKAGADVTVAFYDWRRPIEEAAEVYLKATIGAVKARTGAARVDIVAHSMGGLVARSYIQSAGYGFDVDQLIML